MFMRVNSKCAHHPSPLGGLTRSWTDWEARRQVAESSL